MPTDSTIAPPQNQRLSITNVSWLLDTRKDTTKNNVSTYSIADGEVSRDTVFEEKRPGAGFETGDFVKEKLGGLP